MFGIRTGERLQWFIVLFISIVFSTACTTRTNQAIYQPLDSNLGLIDDSKVRGSIKGDLSWALSQSTLLEAEKALESYVALWNKELEDGYAIIHVRVAQLELARVYYLLGKQIKGDQVLNELDPLQVL